MSFYSVLIDSQSLIKFFVGVGNDLNRQAQNIIDGAQSENFQNSLTLLKRCGLDYDPAAVEQLSEIHVLAMFFLHGQSGLDDVGDMKQWTKDVLLQNKQYQRYGVPYVSVIEQHIMPHITELEESVVMDLSAGDITSFVRSVVAGQHSGCTKSTHDGDRGCCKAYSTLLQTRRDAFSDFRQTKLNECSTDDEKLSMERLWCHLVPYLDPYYCALCLCDSTTVRFMQDSHVVARSILEFLDVPVAARRTNAGSYTVATNSRSMHPGRLLCENCEALFSSSEADLLRNDDDKIIFKRLNDGDSGDGATYAHETQNDHDEFRSGRGLASYILSTVYRVGVIEIDRYTTAECIKTLTKLRRATMEWFDWNRKVKLFKKLIDNPGASWFDGEFAKLQKFIPTLRASDDLATKLNELAKPVKTCVSQVYIYVIPETYTAFNWCILDLGKLAGTFGLTSWIRGSTSAILTNAVLISQTGVCFWDIPAFLIVVSPNEVAVLARFRLELSLYVLQDQPFKAMFPNDEPLFKALRAITLLNYGGKTYAAGTNN